MDASHLGYGFLVAFVGFLAPAMLNMTTVRTTIEQSKTSGFLFALGATVINTIHSLIAFSFLRHLHDNPNIIKWVKQLGVIVLFSLAYFFYQKSKKIVTAKDKKNNMPAFWEGALMSFLNMLAVPYYFTVALTLDASGQINALAPNIYYLSAGVFLGGFAILGLYAYAAEFVAKKSEFITKNLNLILSVIFTIIALSVIVSLVT